MLAASSLTGGIVGHVLALSGINDLLATVICGFLPVPLTGFIRYNLAKIFMKIAESDAEVPMAFSIPVCMIIGLVVACIVAFAFMTFSGMQINFFSGNLVALLTVMIVSIIMSVRLMTK